jgi:hypothetical protein
MVIWTFGRQAVGTMELITLSKAEINWTVYERQVAADANANANDKDQLPGRLQRLQATQNEDAGPVNCIRLFGRVGLPVQASFLMAPL